MEDLRIFKGENGLYGLRDEDLKLIKKPFADFIASDGRFKTNGKCGILNIKTGKIIKRPFAHAICDDGRFQMKRKLGVLDLKTGEIIKKAV